MIRISAAHPLADFETPVTGYPFSYPFTRFRNCRPILPGQHWFFDKSCRAASSRYPRVSIGPGRRFFQSTGSRLFRVFC